MSTRIEDLHERLIEAARQRVRAGQLTERGLARLCGMSQPHMHNVFKHIRALSTGSADRLMRALDLSIEGLLWQVPEGTHAGVCAVPLLRNPIGPGSDVSFAVFEGYIPFPDGLVKCLVQPVAARLAFDPVLPNPFAANDLVLLDQNAAARRESSGPHYWVVAEESGLRIRYVRLDSETLYLAGARGESCEANADDPSGWPSIPLAGLDILDVVRARIVWIGREMEIAPAGPARPPGGFN